MNEIRNVCVYCGSSLGNSVHFHHAAAQLGTELAHAGIGLVFGGGAQGLMGIVARATLAAGGRVIGILPDFLDEMELGLKDATELVIVNSMHMRKQLMFERTDACIALPGGVGTLEEFAEVLTLTRLQRHQKPLLLLNIDDYWRPLLSLFAHMHNFGFLGAAYDIHYLVAERVEDVLPMIFAAARHAPDISEPAITERRL